MSSITICNKIYLDKESQAESNTIMNSTYNALHNKPFEDFIVPIELNISDYGSSDIPHVIELINKAKSVFGNAVEIDDSNLLCRVKIKGYVHISKYVDWVQKSITEKK